MGTKQIIELNGRLYDAATGRAVKKTEVENTAAAKKQRVKTVDGFVHSKKHAVRKVAGTKAKRTVKKSQTLMRTAVKKPKATKTAAQHVAQARPSVKKFRAPQSRTQRAQQTKKHGLVRRFGDINIPKATHTATEELKDISKKTSQAAHVAAAAVSHAANDAMHASQAAIENAVSHTQPKRKKAKLHHRVAFRLNIKPQLVSTMAAVMAFVILGGFFTYQNAPNLSMRLAAMRSDVDGSLPSYLPAGYDLHGPIRYEKGKIVVEYKSNSDNRGFEITEAKSAWDTESLRQNFVENKSTSYQTVQTKGKTVYLYGQSNATWVDGGVWYTVEGKSSLSADQLNKLVNSL